MNMVNVTERKMNLDVYDRVEAVLAKLHVQNTMRNSNYVYNFADHVSEAQMVSLEKMAKFGWHARKIYYATKDGKRVLAVALSTRDCAGWLYPDGKFVRADVNKRTAYLDGDWKEQV
jgi:hypothetical protein